MATSCPPGPPARAHALVSASLFCAITVYCHDYPGRDNPFNVDEYLSAVGHFTIAHYWGPVNEATFTLMTSGRDSGRFEEGVISIKNLPAATNEFTGIAMKMVFQK